jgi:ubiquinone/menaquinone biosynthesis C-methylase UbiE
MLAAAPGVTIPVARRVGPDGEVVALDIQPGMLRRAREKAQSARLANIQFVQAGAADGNLARNHFDRILLVTVLGEIPDREAALKEIFAALKPGGILSITEVIFDPHFQTRTSLILLADRVGFRELEFFGHRLAFTLNLEKPADGAIKRFALCADRI